MIEPTYSHAEIVRGPHRSTSLHVQFDISPLMDSHGRALVSGEELERNLVYFCERAVRSFLAMGRETVPGHP